MIKKTAFGLVLLFLLTFTYFNGMLHFQYVAINMDAALTSLWLLRSVTLAVFLYLGLVCRWYKPWTVIRHHSLYLHISSLCRRFLCGPHLSVKVM